jgi:hypothetical protein
MRLFSSGEGAARSRVILSGLPEHGPSRQRSACVGVCMGVLQGVCKGVPNGQCGEFGRVGTGPNPGW